MTRFRDLDAGAYDVPDALAAGCQSPALVVHLDRVRENIRRVLAHTGGPHRWRPHVKTAKIPAVIAELARAGVRSYKCATTRELACLLDVLEREAGGHGDVLIAYPPTCPAVARLEDLAARHGGIRLSVVAEDPDAAAELPPSLGVFVDVNTGMNRTGVPADDRRTIADVARRAGSRFRGVHYYDGHVHGDDEERRRLAFAGYADLVEIVRSLDDAGMRVAEIVTSGTRTYREALAYAPFEALDGVTHRVSPGTVVYHDLRSEREIPSLDLVPAALVLSRVVSRPAPAVVTCDAGSKAIAAESGDPCAYVLGHDGLLPLTPSEEHLPMRVVSGPTPPRGAILMLVPRHVCPTVNLAEEAVLMDGGAVVGIAPVTARAHELLVL